MNPLKPDFLKLLSSKSETLKPLRAAPTLSLETLNPWQEKEEETSAGRGPRSTKGELLVVAGQRERGPQIGVQVL